MNATFHTAATLALRPGRNLHPSQVHEWDPQLAAAIAAGRVIGAVYPVPNATGDPSRCAADQCDEIRRRMWHAHNAGVAGTPAGTPAATPYRNHLPAGHPLAGCDLRDTFADDPGRHG